MNIFVLDTNQKKCAKWHLDKHVVKMPLETAQLLSSVHYMHPTTISKHNTDKYYKEVWNHPCKLWAAESLSNYNWLCKLGKELSREYTHRYGKVHKTEKIIDWLTQFKPNIQDKGLTPFALAMPEDCKTGDPNCIKDNVLSYRKYYNSHKQHIAVWKKRKKPFWYE